MKLIFHILLISSLFFAGKEQNLLRLNKRTNYSETNRLSNHKLLQQICYNKPGVMDAGYCHTLSITFKDYAQALKRKSFNLDIDTSMVTCEYGIVSAWNWGNEQNEITGELEILNWSNNEIEVREDISVTDLRRNRTVKFIGTRTFYIKE